MFKYLLLILAFLCIYPFVANCFVRAAPKPDLKQTSPWKIWADLLEIRRETGDWIAKGNVKISKGNNTLSSDYGRYNYNSHKIFFPEHFQGTIDSAELKAKQGKFDLESKEGWIKKGEIFLKKNHLHLYGEKISRIAPKLYKFKNASLTVCDGEIPVWSIRSSQGTVPLEGYAKLWHTRFLIKGYPVLYSPFLMLPVQDRQSGFLVPSFSHHSRNGVGITLPYYYIINKEQDLTFAANYLSERGMRLVSEYRITPAPESKGLFRLEWLRDEKTADTEAQEYKNFDEDGLTRENKDRFWLRGKYDGSLFDGEYETKLDLDLVSDQNYLREFDSAEYGFDSSREVFLDKFGRDINNNDSILRENIWTVTKDIEDYVELEPRFEFYQNSTVTNENFEFEQDPTIQKLPEISLDIYEHQLLNTPFDWRAENQVTYYWRSRGNRGIRLNTQPRLSLPLSNNYATAILEAGWDQTVYYTEEYAQDSKNWERIETNGDILLQGSLFSNLFKTYELNPETKIAPTPKYEGKSAWEKIKHSIRPQIKYIYRNNQKNELPEYARENARPKLNRITFALNNILTRRRDKVVRAGKNKYRINKDYLDFLEFELEQSFHIPETHRDTQREKYPRRPFSDLRSRLVFNPTPLLNLESDIWFSPSIEEITEHEHFLNLNYQNRIQGYIGFDYQRDLEHYIHRKDQSDLEILRLGGEFELNKHWEFRTNYSRDLEESELLDHSLGVNYTHQCWGWDLELSRDGEETSISLQVELSQIWE